jgi:hypothetical protein
VRSGRINPPSLVSIIYRFPLGMLAIVVVVELIDGSAEVAIPPSSSHNSCLTTNKQ